MEEVFVVLCLNYSCLCALPVVLSSFAAFNTVFSVLLPAFQQQYTGPKQVARRSDVDMNGHINNVTYLAWAIESMPNDVYESHRVCEVRTFGIYLLEEESVCMCL